MINVRKCGEKSSVYNNTKKPYFQQIRQKATNQTLSINFHYTLVHIISQLVRVSGTVSINLIESRLTIIALV